jgi:peptidylprolyl isomerase/peptidyl-prolyl cis-trans isomerase B (cyclophilin B)
MSITRLILSIVLLLPASGWAAAPTDVPLRQPAAAKPNGPVSGTELSGKRIVLETDRGSLTIELFPDVAPKTAARFTELVKKGFYESLPFYRVLPKFLVQTGDPVGDGTGGSGQTIPAEFNEKKHVTGTVGIARKHDPDSADSQFYICLEPQPFLDGKYTVFGQVVDGLDVLGKIREHDLVRKIIVRP